MKTSEGSDVQSFALFKYLVMTVCVLTSSYSSIVPQSESPSVSDVWVIEEVGDIGKPRIAWNTHPANRTSIALDLAGKPHIAFQNIETGEISYAYKDATGNWNIETVVSEDVKGIYATLALDSHDRPVICYRNRSMSGYFAGLSCAFSEASGWRHEVVDDTHWAGLYISLKLDSMDRPHLAHSTSLGDLRYAWRDGATWNVTTLRDYTAGAPSSISLDLDSNDNPHIALRSGGPELGLWYYSLNGTEWDKEVVDPSTRAGDLYSMALDGSNLPHMVYLDSVKQVLLYAYNDGNLWHIRSVDPEMKAGFGSFSVDSNGNPHIAYEYRRETDLQYAYMYNGSWRKEIVDSEGLVGYQPSLAVDSYGVPSVSYIDWTDKLLMYATKARLLKPYVSLNIDPDTLNLKSKGRWITAYLTTENARAEDINASSLLLNDVVTPAWWDIQHETILMVKFDRSAVQAILSVSNAVDIKVTGQWKDGESFEAHDTIRVINPGRESTGSIKGPLLEGIPAILQEPRGYRPKMSFLEPPRTFAQMSLFPIPDQKMNYYRV